MDIDFTRAVLAAKVARDAILRLVGSVRPIPSGVAPPELQAAWEAYSKAQQQVGFYALKECGVNDPTAIWNGLAQP